MAVLVSVVVPVPCWVNVPVPLILPASVVALRLLMTRAPLLAILPAMLLWPVTVPSPSCKVPALMVVVPV